MAELYRRQGRYADAEPLYKRLLANYEKALGPDHPDIAASLNSLAALYGNLARHGDAELLYKQSLAIHEKALGPDHREVARAVDNLARRLRTPATGAPAQKYSPGGERRPAKGCSEGQPLRPGLSWKSRFRPRVNGALGV